MASEEHLELSKFIKNVHLSLRKKCKQIGSDLAWEQHCKDETNLKKYADFMKKLAIVHWNNNEKSNSKVISRIEWIYSFSNLYFYGNELEKQRIKETQILNKINLTCDLKKIKINDKLKLLDVGSCYNPFKIYDCFEVIAIDIAPACCDVLKCDFINVPLANETIFTIDSVTHLKKKSFHIIVFSLLLEYLPTPELRLKCCEKAYMLLETEGILVIITPDSKHVGANAKFMKSWRYNLAKIGFSRVKYEKLPYLHCMVFRKSFNCEITKRWVQLNENKEFFESLFIPQDFQEENNDLNTRNNLHKLPENNLNFLNELPYCNYYQ